MKIRSLYSTNKLMLSFEVFPPARDGNIKELLTVVHQLARLKPDFISVTYGAGGSTQDMSLEIASKIKNNISLEVLAHLTCVQATKADIATILNSFKKRNINNVLALRGDPPTGEQVFKKTEGGFGYANELVEFIKANYNFSIGVAGYPEKHVEAPNLTTDIENLKRKVDAGADFIITQLFFNNDDFYRFRDMAQNKGIEIPIIPGIFPIFNYKQIAKIASLCGANIPNHLNDTLAGVSKDNEEVAKYGTEYAIRQSQDLLDNGIAGLHFYSMNKSRHVAKIVRELDLNREEKDEIKKRITGGAV
ncbi:MAG: methylenetetrahydrofolate reductase [NAD(P)H] [Deltaproteobacteria bacterium]|nr:methylenetetrahydrofolate reductase [NAD(P)H] [Deltaproteobacteria bacterium]